MPATRASCCPSSPRPWSGRAARTRCRLWCVWANQTGTPLVPVSSGAPHFYGDTVPSVPGAVMVDLSPDEQDHQDRRRNRMAVIEPGVTYAQLQPELAKEGMMRRPAALSAGQQVGGRQPARAAADPDPPLQLRAARAAAQLRGGLGRRAEVLHRRVGQLGARYRGPVGRPAGGCWTRKGPLRPTSSGCSRARRGLWASSPGLRCECSSCLSVKKTLFVTRRQAGRPGGPHRTGSPGCAWATSS